MFSARFDKQGEDDQFLDEIEFHKKLKINQNLTESDFDNNDATSQLKQQCPKQESKYSCWRFDEIISYPIFFYKAAELKGSNCIKTQIGSLAILNIENDD